MHIDRGLIFGLHIVFTVVTKTNVICMVQILQIIQRHGQVISFVLLTLAFSTSNSSPSYPLHDAVSAVTVVRIIFGNILLGSKTLFQLSLYLLICGRSRTLSICSRVVTREIFRTIVELSILSAIPELFEKLFCDVITPIICPSISDEQHGRSTLYGD
jgi:multidrug transporter EmrE-like cation transporter